MDKPIAKVKEVQKWKTIKRASVIGLMQKVRVPVGTETVRSAYCSQHSRTSHTMSGVNEHGWVFWCAAYPHYFIASAPVEEDKASE